MVPKFGTTSSRSPHVWFLKKSTVCLDAIKIMCYNYSLCDTIKEG